jgi:hypothetical protein
MHRLVVPALRMQASRYSVRVGCSVMMLRGRGFPAAVGVAPAR